MTEFNYEELASRTKSDKFFHHKVSRKEVLEALLAFSSIGARLDVQKKAMFYGKGNDECAQGEKTVLTLVDQIFNTAADLGTTQQAIDILHSIYGKMTEAAELADLLLATMHGANFDVVNFAEEIGDGQWYDAIGVRAVGSTIRAEQERNILKLRKRFPDKFTEAEAINRDHAAERVVLEAQQSLPGVDAVQIAHAGMDDMSEHSASDDVLREDQ